MTVNPLDLKNALLAKHAQHVVLVHFPIALFITGVALDFAARWVKRWALAGAAYINLSLAALATLPTVVTGLVAWRWALEGQRLKGVLLMHLVSGLISTGLIWAVWLLHFRARRTPASLALKMTRDSANAAATPTYLLVLEVVAVTMVAFTGHLGGILSGVNT